MSHFHKSKLYDLIMIDMFTDTSQYPDDIFTIDNVNSETYSRYILVKTSNRTLDILEYNGI